MAGFDQLAKIASLARQVVLFHEEMVDYEITKGLMDYIDTSPSTAKTVTDNSAAPGPVITSAVVCTAIAAFLLGLTILSAILYAGRKFTNFDVLIFNHLFVDFLTIASIAPMAMLFTLTTASQSTDYMHSYFISRFLAGMVQRAAGLNLLVLSLHQMGSLICASIPSSSIVTFLRRHRRRNLLSALLLVFVWLTALASELLFMGLIHILFTPDGKTAVSHVVLQLVTEIPILIFVILPGTIPVMVLIYIAIFGVCCRPAFRRIITETASDQSVFYSPNADVHDDMPDRAKLLDFNENGQSSPSNSGVDQQIFFENTVTGDTVEPNAGSSNGLAGGQSGDGEFSRDSLKALLVLTSSHFFLQTVFDSVGFFIYFSFIAVEGQIVLIFVKGIADFLLLLLVPRYRGFLMLGVRRFRGSR